MAAHNEAGESARIDEGLNMKKLMATILFTVLAIGSIECDVACSLHSSFPSDETGGSEPAYLHHQRT